MYTFHISVVMKKHNQSRFICDIFSNMWNFMLAQIFFLSICWKSSLRCLNQNIKLNMYNFVQAELRLLYQNSTVAVKADEYGLIPYTTVAENN